LLKEYKINSLEVYFLENTQMPLPIKLKLIF
jgi:hypothetical protein